jgi:hypothetical protein
MESGRLVGGVEVRERLKGEEPRSLAPESRDGLVLAGPAVVHLGVRRRGGLSLDLQRDLAEPRATLENQRVGAFPEDGERGSALAGTDLPALLVVSELDSSGTGRKRT